jgi:hypothetical protein
MKKSPSCTHIAGQGLKHLDRAWRDHRDFTLKLKAKSFVFASFVHKRRLYLPTVIMTFSRGTQGRG